MLLLLLSLSLTQAVSQQTKAQPCLLGFESTLVPTDAVDSLKFGKSAAMDGTTLVVGTQQADQSAGAVYVFVLENGVWSQEADLPSDCNEVINPGDWFGTEVALDGDRLVVGATREDSASPMNPDCNSGAAYVFVRSAGQWSLEDKLVPNSASCFTSSGAARIGSGVDICGDTVVVGAPGDDKLGCGPDYNSGSAFVFEWNGSEWLETAKLTSTQLTSSDHFGAHVAIDGDTIAIGAPDNESLQNGEGGAVYIFEKPPTGWATTDVEDYRLESSDLENRDEFGRNLALHGARLLVGAQYDDDSGTDSGSAYLFENVGSGWMEIAKLKASDGRPGDQFGSRVSLQGERCLVSAVFADPFGRVDGGAIYVFNPPYNTTTMETAKLTACDVAAADQLGVGLAQSGMLVVGTATRDGYGSISEGGSARVFDLAAQRDPLITIADAGDGGGLFFHLRSPCPKSVAERETHGFLLISSVRRESPITYGRGFCRSGDEAKVWLDPKNAVVIPAGPWARDGQAVVSIPSLQQESLGFELWAQALYVRGRRIETSGLVKTRVMTIP